MIATLAYMMAGGALVLIGIVVGSNLVTKGVAFPINYNKSRTITQDTREE